MPQAPSCPVCQIHAESVFRVEGLDCHEEVALIERRLKGTAGLEAIRADVVLGRLTVSYDAAALSAAAIADAVADTGMRAWLERESPARISALPGARGRALPLGLSGAALAIGLALDFAGVAPLAAAWCFGLATALGAWFWAGKAWSAARLAALDINVLMAVAVIGALAIRQWSEAATVAFLFALAQWLESFNMERARLAIRALMELAPSQALVRRGPADVVVAIDEVRVDDIVIVRPGEKIPLDGVVAAGSSDVNQAPITGESMPAPKAPGADVFAGTINGAGALEVRVTRLKPDSTLARIIGLVEHAQSERAPSQTFVERFARVYTPVVVGLAAAIAVVPPLVFQQPFPTWIYRALVVLVISCPCALVISTPVAIMSALAGAARKGVLVKGGRHMETLGRVACVAFDKTGTLTRGHPEVTGVSPVGGSSGREVLRVAAALEARSTHPIARAVLRRARRDGVVVPAGDGHEALPGLGAEGLVDGAPALAGNHRLFEERGLCSPAVEAVLAGVEGAGETAVLVAHRGRTVGLLSVADAPRGAGPEAVGLLRRQAIRHVVMLTGDNESTATRVAAAMGITEVRAGLLPQDKVAAVAELRAAYGSVAMVGDGVNDAPALAAADVGIAMGTAGSDAALETADIALMSDDLLRIPYAVRLSRATLRTIRWNIGFAIGLKALFLGLAAVGQATLWMAVAADMGASLLVIGLGLRLLRFD
jgi:Zn2+/Cd2+-exporting ATPase